MKILQYKTIPFTLLGHTICVVCIQNQMNYLFFQDLTLPPCFIIHPLCNISTEIGSLVFVKRVLESPLTNIVLLFGERLMLIKCRAINL
jgi:hypothetical protein